MRWAEDEGGREVAASPSLSARRSTPREGLGYSWVFVALGATLANGGGLIGDRLGGLDRVGGQDRRSPHACSRRVEPLTARWPRWRAQEPPAKAHRCNPRR